MPTEALKPQDQKFLDLARKRNSYLPQMFEAGDDTGIYRTPDPKKTDRMRAIANLYVGEVNVIRLDNLIEADFLSRSSRIVVTANHITDLDHAAKRHVLEQLGFREFADRLVYPAGLKMDERSYIRMFMGAEHTVFIPTPDDLAKLQQFIARQRKTPFLTDAQFEEILTYRQYLNTLKAEAKRKTDDLIAGGMISSIYPEATRTRHPEAKIQRAKSSTALYTLFEDIDPNSSEGPDAFVLPMSITGLEKVLPSERVPRFWRVKHPITASFGKPYSVKKIWCNLIIKALKEMKAEKADYMNAKIIATNPEIMDPIDAPFYRPILELTA